MKILLGLSMLFVCSPAMGAYSFNGDQVYNLPDRVVAPNTELYANAIVQGYYILSVNYTVIPNNGDYGLSPTVVISTSGSYGSQDFSQSNIERKFSFPGGDVGGTYTFSDFYSFYTGSIFRSDGTAGQIRLTTNASVAFADYDAFGIVVNSATISIAPSSVALVEYFERELPISAVPEPASWGMMIAGFGMMGAAMRTRRRSTKVSFA